MAAVAATPRGYLERPRPSGLADVVDVILDKGIVIDAYIRVALIGIEILTIDARIVIASVDTYLRFADAVNRMDISSNDQAEGLPQLIQHMTEGGAESKTKGALEGAKQKLFGGDDRDDDEDSDSGGNGRQRKRSTSRASSSSGSSRSRSTRSKSRSTSGNAKR
jgi:gas vesicle structural protein